MKFESNILLETDNVVLRPIKLEDALEFGEIALEPSLWLFTPTLVNSEEKLLKYIENGVKDFEKGNRLMFVIVSKKLNKIVGTSSIGNIDEAHKRVEIGWTWLSEEARGSGINKDCKYLLLDYLFNTLGMIRVEFKTDVNNLKSRRALIKIGATEEGVLRSHTLLNNGTRRDTIYYSILNSEWENLKNSVFQEFKKK